MSDATHGTLVCFDIGLPDFAHGTMYDAIIMLTFDHKVKFIGFLTRLNAFVFGPSFFYYRHSLTIFGT